jgi:hypothetical protein
VDEHILECRAAVDHEFLHLRKRERERERERAYLTEPQGRLRPVGHVDSPRGHVGAAYHY